MPIKTFNVSDVLTASDVNTYLMKQAVITCTSSTRPSSPVEGMTIYQTDTDNTWVYNGATWVPNTPMWKVGETTFTNQASPVYNNIFTSNYDVYRLVIRVGVVTSGTNAYLRMRVVNSGGTPQTTNYVAKSMWSNTGIANAVFADQDQATTGFPLGPIGNTDNPGSITVDIYNPFLSTSFTLYNGNFFGTQNGVANYMGLFGGAHQTVASYTGLNFFANSGNITGTVSVYGYR